MERIVMKSQVAKLLFLLLSFLFLTPFISTSLRSSYLYFLFNLLIILLALDAGLLASISKPPHDVDIKKKKPLLLSAVAYSSSSSSSTSKESLLIVNGHQNSLNEDRSSTQEAVTMEPLQKQQLQLQVEVEKKKKKMMAEERVQKLKRCRSKPSIFFIGSCDINEDLGEEEEDHHQQQQQVVQVEEYVGDVMSKQELFMKAEMFIGNFYKQQQQLKMQRQEDHSWKNIHHGLYHRSFLAYTN